MVVFCYIDESFFIYSDMVVVLPKENDGILVLFFFGLDVVLWQEDKLLNAIKIKYYFFFILKILQGYEIMSFIVF